MVTVKLTVSVFVRERAFACGSCRPQAACKNIKTEKLKNMNFMCTYVTAKASALRKAIKLWFIHMTNETHGDICYHWQWMQQEELFESICITEKYKWMYNYYMLKDRFTKSVCKKIFNTLKILYLFLKFENCRRNFRMFF